MLFLDSLRKEGCIIKNWLKNFENLMPVILVSVFLAISLIAGIEYYRLTNVSRLLISTYQDSLYYTLREDTLNVFPEASDSDKEKISDGAALSLINRDAVYLKNSALAYAKKHNLENRVRPLYEEQWISSNKQQTLHKKVTKKKYTQRSKKNMKIAYRPLPAKFKSSGVFKWPIERESFWISSKFGPRKKGFHKGIDLAAIKGTPIKAAAAGLVAEVGFSPKGYGKTVVIAHNFQYQTRYAHLHGIYVRKGQRVEAGQLIGIVGDTGNVRGKNGSKNASHLHFEVKEFGKHINPLYVLI